MADGLRRSYPISYPSGLKQATEEAWSITGRAPLGRRQSDPIEAPQAPLNGAIAEERRNEPEMGRLLTSRHGTKTQLIDYLA